MKVLVVGGSGMIGRRIVAHLQQAGHQVTVSTRGRGRPDGLPPDVGVVHWDTRAVPPWREPIDALVNVSGEPLIGRFWTQKVKRELMRSRAGVNHALTQWIQAQDLPPRVFVTASAVGYYGPHPEGPVTEASPPGDDFLATMCREWEEAAFGAASDRTRVVATRFGILLDPDGGALAMMRPLWKLGLGGSVGGGKQPFPWITSQDAARAVVRAVEDDALRGGVNVVAPQQVTNKEFTKALGAALHRPAPWYVPTLALRVLYGDGSEILAHGQPAVPERLAAHGFQWHDPELRPALKRLVDRG